MQQINFRLADREREHLEKYCELTERSIGDVLRQCVRNLYIKGALNPLDAPVILPNTDASFQCGAADD